MTIAPIIPTARREAFDGPEWTFELKFDGFRAIADTVNGRMVSKRGNRMHRFEALLGSLPADCVLDGEVVALDATGRPMFADLMFGRRPPIFVAFDVLVDRGEDVRALPLARRKAVLKRLVAPEDGSLSRTGCRARAAGYSSLLPRTTSRASSPSASPIPTRQVARLVEDHELRLFAEGRAVGTVRAVRGRALPDRG